MVKQERQRSWLLFVGIILWALVCVVATMNSFENVAFICSCFLALYFFGFRDKWPEDGPSAYSVFNDGGRSIPGTFTAQHLDDQFRGIYGSSKEDEQFASQTVSLASKRSEIISADEKLRRRQIAAAAAERRLLGGADKAVL